MLNVFYNITDRNLNFAGNEVNLGVEKLFSFVVFGTSSAIVWDEVSAPTGSLDSSLNRKMILRHSFLYVLCVSIFLKETHGSSIPGIPGVDYPNFSEIPPTSFRCPESELGGFYPDFETRCQVFHYCEDGRGETFICPVGTIFNPQINSCDRWFNYECNAPLKYEKIDNDSKDDYEAESDGGGIFQSSGNLFDKMASLYEDESGETYGHYKTESGRGISSNGDSRYEGSSQNEVSTMLENEKIRKVSENPSGNVHSDLKQNTGFEDIRPFQYESDDRNIDGWDSKASEADGGLKKRGQKHSDVGMKSKGLDQEHLRASMRVDGYEGMNSHSDHRDQSSKGLGELYYRNPTIYNYHTLREEDNRNQIGDSFSYEGKISNAQKDSHSSVYGSDMEFDDFDGSYVDSDHSMDLQKRISEYRRRPRPKPVVSLVESDLEIVTLPPQRPKRSRISLVLKNADPPVTEPMTTTTEFSADVERMSETTDSASVTKSTSDDATDDESQMSSSDSQQERSENERDFGDWFTTEESSGDAEDFLQSEDSDESLDLNQKEAESEGTDANIQHLHNMMRPNLFYVDSNRDYGVKDEVSTPDSYSEELKEKKYDTTHAYKNEEFGMDHGEYNHNFNKEIEDLSDVLKSSQYGESFNSEKYQNEKRSEEKGDFGELFQTVIDGEVKSLVRLGEEIIDPTEYYPDWNGESSIAMEYENTYDVVGKDNEKYVEGNYDETDPRSEESQGFTSFNLDETRPTTSETSEGYNYDYTDEYSYQDGGISRDLATDSTGSFSEEPTFITSLEEEFPTTQAYDTLNTDGVYGYEGSRDPDSMESFYTGDDVGYTDDQSHISSDAYIDEQSTLEEQGPNNDDTIMSSIDDVTSSDLIYYYTTDMGSQFVTDQPDMEVATTAVIGEEYSPNAGIQGKSVYSYETSQSDDSFSNAEFQEEYFTTDSTISITDTEFVSDQSDFGISSTAVPDKEFSRGGSIEEDSDEEFQEQYFSTDSYETDTDTQFVTIQPDSEISSKAMHDGEEYSKDTSIYRELGSAAYMKSHSDDAESEFQEYLKEDSDFSELKADLSKEQEKFTASTDHVERSSELINQDETKAEFVTSSSFSTVGSTRTSDTSKTMGSSFIKSTNSKKHHTISETSHFKESSSDSSGDQTFPDFDFESLEDTDDLESFGEGSQSTTDESSTSSDDANIKPQSEIKDGRVEHRKKSSRTFSSNEFMDIDRLRHPGRTGKLLEGSKFAKLTAFVKKMIAAKKKAKLNIAKKLLPSSEWNSEA